LHERNRVGEPDRVADILHHQSVVWRLLKAESHPNALCAVASKLLLLVPLTSTSAPVSSFAKDGRPCGRPFARIHR
jgi:hypothetical protein